MPAELEQRAGQRHPRVDEHRAAVGHGPPEPARRGGRVVGQQVLLARPQERLGRGIPAVSFAVAASWFIRSAADA